MATAQEILSGYPRFLRVPKPAEERFVGDPGNPGFQNSWGGTAAFYKDVQSRRVFLRGQVSTAGSETPTSQVFVLPEDHRPSVFHRFSCPARDKNNGSIWVAAAVGIDTDGSVTLHKMTDFDQIVRNVTWNGTDVVVTFWKIGKADVLHLDGIHFLAA